MRGVVLLSVVGALALGVAASSPVAGGDPVPTGANVWTAAAVRQQQQAPADLPDDVYLKTPTQTYNNWFYFVLADDTIWHKPNRDLTGLAGSWTPLPLPAPLPGDRIEAISADDWFVVAIERDTRAIWTFTGVVPQMLAMGKWTKRWGSPFWNGLGMPMPEETVAWNLSFLSPYPWGDQYLIDRSGYRKILGVGVTTIFALRTGGQRITIIDPWLPADESYEMCGPKRGAFQADSLTASGSTTFVMNRYGDMFTRLWDFDMAGSDWVFIGYSWGDVAAMGPNAFLIRQMPPFDWVQHPKIPGTVTDTVSVLKIGRGGVNRTMRVEGMDAEGHTGFWEKDVTELEPDAWTFRRTDQPLIGQPIDNKPYDSSDETLGPVEDYAYDGGRLRFGLPRAPRGWTASMPNLNPYCDPAQLTVRFDTGYTLDLVAHNVQDLRQKPRWGRGFTEQPMPLRVWIEVPKETYDNRDDLPPEARGFISSYLGNQQFKLTQMSATLSGVELIGATPWTGPYVWAFDRAT